MRFYVYLDPQPDFTNFVEVLRLCVAEAYSSWFLLPRGIALFRSLEGDYR